jgi:hypothetical protein
VEQEIQDIFDGSRWARCELWIQHQVDSHVRYLRLPVTDDVASVAVQEYDDYCDLESPFPQGMSLLALSPAEDRWFVQPVNPSAEKTPSRRPVHVIEVITITRQQLRSDYEFVGDAFKKEVPVIHPSLTKFNIDLEKIIPPEFGIIVAWKFVGGNAWMDRYGHIVPKQYP